MKELKFYNNLDFVFNNFNLRKFHYTDNSSGAPMNFLAYMIKGRAKIVSKNRTLNIFEGDIFYIPKNLSYESFWYGNDEINFLSFAFSKLSINKDLNFAFQKIDRNENLIKEIVSIPTVCTNIDCKTLSIFYDVMDKIIPKLKPKVQNRSEIIFEGIKNCIEKHPFSQMSEIATICNISESYIYTVFKKFTNVSPNEYKQEILCRKALELLSTTEKSVEEITSCLNFSSSSYFRKILKKHTGMTPREIRKNRMF